MITAKVIVRTPFGEKIDLGPMDFLYPPENGDQIVIGTESKTQRTLTVFCRQHCPFADEPDERLLILTEPSKGLWPGVWVKHRKFGTGQILEIEGSKLTIDFFESGRKMVLDTFVERAQLGDDDWNEAADE